MIKRSGRILFRIRFKDIPVMNTRPRDAIVKRINADTLFARKITTIAIIEMIIFARGSSLWIIESPGQYWPKAISDFTLFLLCEKMYIKRGLALYQAFFDPAMNSLIFSTAQSTV